MVCVWQRERRREKWRRRSFPDTLLFGAIEHEQKRHELQRIERVRACVCVIESGIIRVFNVHRIIFAFKICLLHYYLRSFLCLSHALLFLLLWRTLKRNIRLVFGLLWANIISTCGGGFIQSVYIAISFEQKMKKKSIFIELCNKSTHFVAKLLFTFIASSSSWQRYCVLIILFFIRHKKKKKRIFYVILIFATIVYVIEN